MLRRRCVQKCTFAVAVLEVRQSKARPARLARTGLPSTEHAGLLWGCIAGTATQCPQSGFFQPSFAIFGRFPISFGLTPSRDVPVNLPALRRHWLGLREPPRPAMDRSARG